jgi:hypothetical protein
MPTPCSPAIVSKKRLYPRRPTRRQPGGAPRGRLFFDEIREGWVADLLLHKGDVLADLFVLAEPKAKLALIIKDGEIIKAEY